MNTRGGVQSSSVSRRTFGLQQIVVVPVGGATAPVEAVAVALSNNTSQAVGTGAPCSAATPAPLVGPSVRVLQESQHPPVVDDREMRRRVSQSPHRSSKPRGDERWQSFVI